MKLNPNDQALYKLYKSLLFNQTISANTENYSNPTFALDLIEELIYIYIREVLHSNKNLNRQQII